MKKQKFWFYVLMIPTIIDLLQKLVREQYPNVKIFVRAKNRIDAYEYLDKGIDNIYRETLGTAVEMVRRCFAGNRNAKICSTTSRTKIYGNRQSLDPKIGKIKRR
ncbi:hypothetical protein [Chryseobacterium indoltheticum]|uniref:hypothetical protein n=1 Tax=Chryseobacterium indoltheticum TaxID=254 RepID=UPI003F4923FE